METGLSPGKESVPVIRFPPVSASSPVYAPIKLQDPSPTPFSPSPWTQFALARVLDLAKEHHSPAAVAFTLGCAKVANNRMPSIASIL